MLTAVLNCTLRNRVIKFHSSDNLTLLLKLTAEIWRDLLAEDVSNKNRNYSCSKSVGQQQEIWVSCIHWVAALCLLQTSDHTTAEGVIFKLFTGFYLFLLRSHLFQSSKRSRDWVNFTLRGIANWSWHNSLPSRCTIQHLVSQVLFNHLIKHSNSLTTLSQTLSHPWRVRTIWCYTTVPTGLVHFHQRGQL